MKAKRTLLLALLATTGILASCRTGDTSPSSTPGPTGQEPTSSSPSSSTPSNDSTGLSPSPSEVVPDGSQSSFDAYFRTLLEGNFKLSYTINNDAYSTISNDRYFIDHRTKSGYALLPSVEGLSLYELSESNGKVSGRPSVRYDSSTQVDQRHDLLADVNPLASLLSKKSSDYPTWSEAEKAYLLSDKEIVESLASLIDFDIASLSTIAKTSFVYDASTKAVEVTFYRFDQGANAYEPIRSATFSEVGASKDEMVEAYISSFTLPSTSLQEDQLSLLTGDSLVIQGTDETYEEDSSTPKNAVSFRYEYSPAGALFQNQQLLTAYYRPGANGSIERYVLLGNNTLSTDKANLPLVPNSTPSHETFSDLTAAVKSYFSAEAKNFLQGTDGYFHYYGTRWNDASNLFKIQNDYRRFDDFYLIPQGGKIAQAVFVGKTASVNDGNPSYRKTTLTFLDPASNPIDLPKTVDQDDADTPSIKEALAKLDTAKGFGYTIQAGGSSSHYVSDSYVLTYEGADKNAGTGYYQNAQGLWNFSFDKVAGTVSATGAVDKDGKLTSQYAKTTLDARLLSLSQDKASIVQKAPISNIYEAVELGGAASGRLMGETLSFKFDDATKTITGATFRTVGGASSTTSEGSLDYDYDDAGLPAELKAKLETLGTVAQGGSWDKENGVVGGIGDYLTADQLKAIPYISKADLDGSWQAYNPGGFLEFDNNLDAAFFTEFKAKLSDPASGFVDTKTNNNISIEDETIYHNEKVGIYVSCDPSNNCFYVSKALSAIS